MSQAVEITLKYPARCADCGAALAAGEKARYYPPNPGYRRGRVFGYDCHFQKSREDPELASAANGWRHRG